MNKLPITLITIVRNSGDKLKKLIDYHRDIVSEVVVVDQSSNDGTWEVAKELADFAVKRRPKGRCEPDRNFAMQLGTQPWVLYLDDDERLSEDSKKNLAKHLEANADAIWIYERTFVNGISTADVDGGDPHVRLFKRGAIVYGDTIHALPGLEPGAVAYYPEDLEIIHEKTYQDVLNGHNRRKKYISQESVAVEENYIGALTRHLQKHGVPLA